MERPNFLRRFSRQSKPVERPPQGIPLLNPYQQAEFAERPKEVKLGTVVSQAIHNFTHPKYRPDSRDYYSLYTSVRDALKDYDMSSIDIARELMSQTSLNPKDTEFNWHLGGTIYKSWSELCDEVSVEIVRSEMIRKNPKLEEADLMRLHITLRFHDMEKDTDSHEEELS